MSENKNVTSPVTGRDYLPQDSVLNVGVSCFESYHATNSVEINLFRFLTSMRHAPKVDEIRRLTDKKERDKLKAQLPACTPSGLFTKRTNADLIRHSGLMQVDIDWKDNMHIGNYEKLKVQLSNIPNVAFCGKSVSGTGFFLLVPIHDPKRHREHFNALRIAFRQLGINIDESCKDVVRLRGYSYDDSPYINHYAETFYLVENDNENKATPPARPFPQGNEREKNLATIERATAYIEEHNIMLVNDYPSWFQLACSLASAAGEGGRDYFHRISKVDRRAYTKHEADNQYSNCMKGNYKYTLGTFIKLCRDMKVPI